MHQHLDAVRRRLRELEHSRRLLEERIVQLQQARDELKAIAQAVIEAWDARPNTMRLSTAIDFHTAIHGLIVAMEEGQESPGQRDRG